LDNQQPSLEQRKVQRLRANNALASAILHFKKVVIMKNIIIDNISTSYFITEDGKCYNSITNKYLKGQENYKNHYFSYNLTMPDGSKKRCYAHRLVANAYLEPPAAQYT
jgi:predicted HAD superfamily hydrolase